MKKQKALRKINLETGISAEISGIDGQRRVATQLCRQDY